MAQIPLDSNQLQVWMSCIVVLSERAKQMLREGRQPRVCQCLVCYTAGPLGQ